MTADLAEETTGTDGHALGWRYRWLGPASLPFPWAATWGAYGIFFLLFLPGLVASVLLLGGFGLFTVAPSWAVLSVAVTRQLRGAVTKDRPLRHHAAVFTAELHTTRPETPTTTTVTFDPTPLEQ